MAVACMEIWNGKKVSLNNGVVVWSKTKKSELVKTGGPKVRNTKYCSDSQIRNLIHITSKKDI